MNDPMGVLPVFDLPVHPAAELFPMLDDQAMEDLKQDILKAGKLKVPVLLSTIDKKRYLLDGRNRREAVRQLREAGHNINCAHSEHHTTDPLADVLSWNLSRRQLSKSQAGDVALAIEKYEADLAEKRMKVGVKDPAANLRQGTKGRAAAKAAAIMGVSERAVNIAKKLRKEAPDVADQIMADPKLSQNAAVKFANTITDPKEREAIYAEAKDEGVPVSQKVRKVIKAAPVRQAEPPAKAEPAKPVEKAVSRVEQAARLIDDMNDDEMRELAEMFPWEDYISAPADIQAEMDIEEEYEPDEYDLG